MARWLRRQFPVTRSARRSTRSKARLLFQPLEGRVVPTTYTVATTDDAGAGSLRQAILDANANPGADTIAFDPAAFASPQTIALPSPLPTITDSVTITSPPVATGQPRVTVGRSAAAATNFRIFTIDGPGVLMVGLSDLAITGGSTAGFSHPTPAEGAGVRIADEAVTLTRMVVAGNTSSNAGGGLWTGGPLTLNGCTFAGNAAARNSTISGNVANAFGGVVVAGLNGTLTVQNSTITANTATGSSSSAGGLYVGTIAWVPPGAVDLQSTIVAGNVANGRPDLSLSNGVTLIANHSLVGVADGITFAAGSVANMTGTAAAPIDPRLGPLAANGGPTKTHALLAGSPALNAGANPADLATDQRGSPRVVGPAADIGAYEYKPVGVASVQVNDGSAQRSQVRSLTVTFSGPVTFAGDPAAAFQLTSVTGGGTVGLAAAVSANGLGQTVVTLIFTGGSVDPLSGGQLSLADGRFQLSIADGAVTDAATGLSLDGDNNGTAGGAYQSPDDTAAGGPGQVRLFRLFGDATGNGVVDLSDLAAFRGTFNAGLGSPAYLDYLDADNSNTVDLSDLSEFRGRFNQTVF